MMKQFPIRLAVKISVITLLFYTAGYFLLFSIYREIRIKISAIRLHYSGEYEAIQSRVEKERALLSRLEQKNAIMIDSGKTSTDYYTFIRKTLVKRNIQTIKINSSKQISVNDNNLEVFSINFTDNYKNIGIVINDLENGPFFCSIKELHLVSKSLTENIIDASLVVSFRRMDK